MSNPTGDALTVCTDELTFEFTPAQAQAVRAFVARSEREFLKSLRANDLRWVTEQDPTLASEGKGAADDGGRAPHSNSGGQTGCRSPRDSRTGTGPQPDAGTGSREAGN